MAYKPKQPIMRTNDDGQKEKWCSACKDYHPATPEYFYRDNGSKYSLTSSCKESQKKAKEKNVREKTSSDKEEAKTSAHALSLDFDSYQDLFEKLQESARNEMRPIDMHAIWLLNKQLAETIA